MLLLIVTAFVVVGALCARRISFASGLLGVNSVSAAAGLGRTLWLKIVGTTCFVFIAFVLRSVVSTMLALAFKFQDYGNFCPGVFSLCDASCYNQYTHIVQWNAYTPEFVSTVVLISSPLTLLVALWSITSKYTLQLMRS